MQKYFAKTIVIISGLLFCCHISFSQYTRQDSLRGTLNANRSWWDVLKYDLQVTPDYQSKTIKGRTAIRFKVLKEWNTMQIDLQPPMIIDSLVLLAQDAGKNKNWRPANHEKPTRDGNAWLIDLPALKNKSENTIVIYYHGKPREAINPPWDGGWIWSKDAKGRPWMTVACQALGASVWYPCKDHQSDEPDAGATLSITAADSLVAVGNGRLMKKQSNKNGTTTWRWEVKNPINNYNIVPYIGMYANWNETYKGINGNLDCSYWVLDYNIDKARKQFGRDVKPMLSCFEKWFGPYPFYDDSYKLVETPHLGMEHQSAVAYGNGYMNGYLGSDLSGTGWGTKWDFIIIHESGHEWFANNITTKDIADMWVHEGFTNYSEVLFVECQYGIKAANEYCVGLRNGIQNDIPLIGPYGVNKEGSGDMYAKGANLIHTIRQVINNDEVFRSILRGLNKAYYHQTVNTKDVEKYMAAKSGKDLTKIFDQYLRDTRIPQLEYSIKGRSVSYRWNNCISGFNMPVKVSFGKKQLWLIPTEKWQTIKTGDWYDGESFEPGKNFYINVKKVDE